MLLVFDGADWGEMAGGTGFFRVDLDVLANAAQSMKTATEQLAEVQRAMSRGAGAEVGPTELNDAVDDFQRTWHYGIGQINKGASAAADGLTKTHDAYRDGDQDFANTLAQISTDLPGNSQGSAQRQS